MAKCTPSPATDNAGRAGILVPRAVVGLRDRALISVMTFAFARIGAVVAMRVED
jgi:hypothetical protein